MGVPGLLPLVKSCTNHVHLRTFRGMRVAIDGFTWLHRAASVCAQEFFHNPRCNGVMRYCVRRLNKIREFGLTPVFILDGRSLPSKGGTDESRQARRSAFAEQILTIERNGQEPPKSLFQQAVAIQWETIETLLHTLNGLGIPYVIAPYEADAQLAFLARNGLVDCVMTEDSDLLPYMCPLTLFKFDNEGMVDAVRVDDVLRMVEMTPNQFIEFCILLGCDYADHIRMMGPKTALKMIKQFGNGPRVIEEARKSTKFTVPDDYERQFERAFVTYNHQMIFDPRDEMMKPLTPVSGRLPGFIGPMIPRHELLDHVMGRRCNGHGKPLRVTAPEPPAQRETRRVRPRSQQMPMRKVVDIFPTLGPVDVVVEGGEVKTQISDALLNL